MNHGPMAKAKGWVLRHIDREVRTVDAAAEGTVGAHCTCVLHKDSDSRGELVGWSLKEPSLMRSSI